jgi:hypothetical protein
MPVPLYKDLEILFSQPTAESKQYPVVAMYQGDKSSGHFEMPFSAQDVTRKLIELGVVSRGRGQVPSTVKRSGLRIPLRDFGSRLWDSLFREAVRESFILAEADCKRDSTDAHLYGLRIKLLIDASKPVLRDLLGLPWEYLYRSDRGQFVALDPATPIVRVPSNYKPVESISTKRPLRILGIVSHPKDTDKWPELELEKEWQDLTEVLASPNHITLERVVRNSKENLLEATRRLLRSGNYHLIHFMGHGDYNEEEQRSSLIFEDEQGIGVPVYSDTLRGLVRNSTARLVIFNACYGARVERGQDPFADIATNLCAADVPAVIAMQYAISDKAAIQFSKHLYESLARGEPVEKAVTEGRKAVNENIVSAEQIDWGTPGLFMRARDGNLFNFPETANWRELVVMIWREALEPKIPFLRYARLIAPDFTISRILLGILIALILSSPVIALLVHYLPGLIQKLWK